MRRHQPADAAAPRSPRPASTRVGVNCGVGPQICLDALVQMGRPSAGLPRSIVPNAGLPSAHRGPVRVRGRRRPTSRDDGAPLPGRRRAHRRRLLRHHARAHRRAHARPRSHAWSGTRRRDGPRRRTATAHAREPPRAGPRAPIAERATAGQPRRATAAHAPGRARSPRHASSISVEIDPPRSVRIERTIEAARLLQEAGVDVVNISDSAMARVRMGALAVAFGIQHDLDLECLVHFTTRDRNLMALESELLGAHALGVRNILALTGDPPRIGDYPTGTGIWDVDSIGLIGILARLNRGRGPGRQADRRARRLHHRLRARPHGGRPGPRARPPRGQDRRRCAPDHDPAHLRARAVGPLHGRAPPRAGATGCRGRCCWASCRCTLARHAEFLHNEVPGITIPAAIRAAMGGAGERGAEVGLDMAHGAAGRDRPLVQGTYIMPSFGRYELAAELVRRIRADVAASSAQTHRCMSDSSRLSRFFGLLPRGIRSPAAAAGRRPCRSHRPARPTRRPRTTSPSTTTPTCSRPQRRPRRPRSSPRSSSALAPRSRSTPSTSPAQTRTRRASTPRHCSTSGAWAGPASTTAS